MNLHRMKEDLLASGQIEEFLKELPGFVVVPEELWEQLRCYVVNQHGRAAAGARFMEEGAAGRGGYADSAQLARMRERVNNAQLLIDAMEVRAVLTLPLCDCWYAANTGQEHPNGLSCPRCCNTGKEQLE